MEYEWGNPAGTGWGSKVLQENTSCTDRWYEWSGNIESYLKFYI